MVVRYVHYMFTYLFLFLLFTAKLEGNLNSYPLLEHPLYLEFNCVLCCTLFEDNGTLHNEIMDFLCIHLGRCIQIEKYCITHCNYVFF